MNFKYAQLANTTGKRWYVYFSYLDPATNVRIRSRLYIPQYKSEALKTRHALKLIHSINAKLDQGWNPAAESGTNTRLYQPLSKALDFVLKQRLSYIEKSSRANYNQRIRALNDWLKLKKKEALLCYEFTPTLARDFMNDLLFERGISGRTYNGYLIDYKGFFNTLVENGYLKASPFHGIKKMKQAEKSKQPWTAEQQKMYMNYLKVNDYDFYMVSMYCYYFAIRPKEICLLKVSNVKLDSGYIEVPASIAKNDRQRFIPIPNIFAEELQQYIHGIPGDLYLCAKDFKPGKQVIAPTRISGRFREISDHLKFGSEIQFYGLKDTCAEIW